MGSNAEFEHYRLEKQLEIYKELLRIIMHSNLYYGDAPEIFDYIEFHKLEKDLNEKK
jgi:hypothetical protein